MEWDIEDIQNEGTSDKEKRKPLEKKDHIPEEVEVVDSKPEYKDYRTWKEIPEKERKHYGI